jgi:acetolactate decarboxylase
MLENFLKPEKASVYSDSWCVEWFGSHGDFVAGKSTTPVSLNRFAGLESLYALGPLEKGRGEVSIFDSVTLISQVSDAKVDVRAGHDYRAGFLVYAIVENWRRATLRASVENERRFEEQLLPLAVESGIDTDRPFPFLVHGQAVQARFHVLCNQSDEAYGPEIHEKSKVHFQVKEAVEIIGFYSHHHRGVFTPPNSDFHMHVRTLDNHVSGHLETFVFNQGITVYLPADGR